MTTVTILDTLTAWARDNICDKILLKLPPDNDDAEDSGYEYTRVHPEAFTMYVPGRDKLPPGILSPIPSVCVRALKGADNLKTGMGAINIQLCFSTWDPGEHAGDRVMPNPENYMEPKKWTVPEARDYFRRHGEGWRDAWNMVDIALREIESVTNIGGIQIDRTAPVEFGPLTEQEAIPDFYPHWFAWVTFTVTYPIIRNIRDVENFL